MTQLQTGSGSFNALGSIGRRNSRVGIQVIPDTLSKWQESTRAIEEDFAPRYDAAEWEENPALNVMREEDEMLLRGALDRLPQPRASLRALVAGTATGRELLLLADREMYLDGVDIAPSYLQIAADKLARANLDDPAKIRLIQSSLESFLRQAPDASYDCISCLFSVLNLLEDWKTALAEFSRVLKPGGLLVFSTYGSSSARVFQALEGESLSYAPSILIRKVPGGLALGEKGEILNARFPEPEEIAEALTRNGLRIVEQRGFLDFLSLLPKDPGDLPKFEEIMRSINPNFAEKLTGLSYPAALLLAREADTAAAWDPARARDFAYVGYVVQKEA